MRHTFPLTREEVPFPIAHVIYRDDVPIGPVFVCDIDKTYLETRFSQLRGLLKIPFELGIDKEGVAGAAQLLRAVRAGISDRAHHPLFFVSASPPQLRRPLERKMLLDGLEYDGIVFKDQAAVLRRRLFDQVTHQVAFKVTAMLHLARQVPAQTSWHLLGDDAEQDALIYSLFADIVAGRLLGTALVATLGKHGVPPELAVGIAQRADELQHRDRVQAILIRLLPGHDGSSVLPFSSRVIGCPTMASTARWLAGNELLSPDAADEIAEVAQPGACVAGTASPDEGGYVTPREFRAER